MHFAPFPNGGFVIHGITGKFADRMSAWFDRDGRLIDAEHRVGITTHGVKRGGPMWKRAEEAGRLYGPKR